MNRAIGSGIVSAALLCAGAVRAGPGARPVDVEGPLSPDAIADLGAARVGSVVFHQALVQNLPPEEEIREAGPRDHARPSPVLVLDVLGHAGARLDLQVRLEDEDGAALMTCTVSRGVGAGWKTVVERICRGTEAMPTASWPRVRYVHVVGAVSEGE